MPDPQPPPRRPRPGAVAIGVVVVAVIAGVLLFTHAPSAAPPVLVHEAVNDHVRVTHSEHPLDVTGADTSAWLAAHLDFAPALPAGLPLDGGAVGYFIDRTCAIVRIRGVTLIVAPARGLGWPRAPLAARDRGFAVLLWSAGDLGYALVGDANDDLARLLARFAP